MASADLLLHPVRLRIVQAFLGDRALTTAQLAAELGDVPPASLYRHVSLLTKAGVLQVAAERRVRAVVERTYVLRLQAAQIQPDEVAAMTPEQHLAAFMAYAAGMLADVERYLMTGTPDLLRDRGSYSMTAMWLTDTEYTDFIRDLSAVFQPWLANAPGKGRRRRTVYNVLVPASEAPRARAGKVKGPEPEPGEETTAPETAAPRAGTQQPAAPKAGTQQPAAPKAATRQTATRQTATRQPAAPKAATRQTATRQTAARQPATPKAAASPSGTRRRRREREEGA